MVNRCFSCIREKGRNGNEKKDNSGLLFCFANASVCVNAGIGIRKYERCSDMWYRYCKEKCFINGKCAGIKQIVSMEAEPVFSLFL